MLLARGRWPELPTLAGVVECPVLRPGGSVLQRPGYDAESGLLYLPSGSFLEVPAAPDRGAALDALAQLREAVRDFPFATEAHRAAWLCALLTPLARAAFSGPSPLNLIDGNVRGCGKSLLADVCAVLLTGRPAARMSVPGPEAELRKAITSLALEAERTVLLDNVAGVLGSPTLDRALTAEVWRDRVLGASRQVALPLAITWYATGNNVSLAGDTARRCLHIRLHSSLARPEKRAGFRHPRLLDWLARERPRLLPAALTM
ncbi:MAG: ATPase, partial [Ketobacter sp.]|nr:ATPase [Ketobacter sp.]